MGWTNALPKNSKCAVCGVQHNKLAAWLETEEGLFCSTYCYGQRKGQRAMKQTKSLVEHLSAQEGIENVRECAVLIGKEKHYRRAAYYKDTRDHVKDAPYRLYVLGGLPKAYLRSTRVVFKLGNREYYVAGYFPQMKNHKQLDAEPTDFNPFGAFFVLCAYASDIPVDEWEEKTRRRIKCDLKDSSYLPTLPAFYDVQHIGELFGIVQTDKRLAPGAIKRKEAYNATIGSYCSVRDDRPNARPVYRSLYVNPSADVYQYIIRNMIAVDNDSIYFEIIIHDDECAGVFAKYNQILGSRFLANINPALLPEHK